MMSGAWSAAEVTGAVSTIAAAISAFCAFVALRRNSRVIQLQVLESILGDIRDLDTDPPSEPRKLFNTIEYLSFIVNRGLIPGTELSDFFKIGIVHWYEKVFPKYDAIGHADPTAFIEFKRLYDRIKSGGMARTASRFRHKIAEFEFWASTVSERQEIFERLAKVENDIREMTSN